MKKRFASAVIIVVLCCLSRSSHGWWDLSHTAINRDAGVAANSLGQIPDAWPRTSPWLPIIDPWFAWAHGVQTTGQNPLYLWICPNIPTYPYAENREPGLYMQTLVNTKFKIPTGSPSPAKTALSFRYHNAADGEVHFSYFTGGSPWGWFVGHYVKEEWAEYMIYTEKMGGTFKNYTATYDSAGNVVYSDGETVEPIVAECKGDPKTIQLAQCAYVKNRLSTKSGGNGITSGLPGPESLTQIADRIRQYVIDIQLMDDSMRKYTFEQRQYDAWLYGWDANACAQLWLMYAFARIEVQGI